MGRRLRYVDSSLYPLADLWLTFSPGPARRLRLHEFKKICNGQKRRAPRRLSIEDAVPVFYHNREYEDSSERPVRVTACQSPASSDFGDHYNSPATQSTCTPPVQNIWTSRLGASSETSSSTSLYIGCKSSNARTQASRFPAKGAHNGFRHPLYRESHEEERAKRSDARQLPSQWHGTKISPESVSADSAPQARDVSRTESTKSSIRSNASTDTIQHILETDSADMVGFGRWRHHKDVSLQWLENKIREEFTGPGANCLFGTKTFATTDHPLVAEYIARKRALEAGREVSAGFLTADANNSSSSLFEPTGRTESSVSIGKDGCIVQTGFLTRSNSIGSTLSGISTSSSNASILEMPPRKDPVPKIFATSVNPDAVLSASIAAEPITFEQAERLKQAASQFSQAAVSSSYFAACLAKEQRDSVLEQQDEAKNSHQQSDHVHFAPDLERRCIIVNPEDAEIAIESDDDDCEILPIKARTPPTSCSRPVKGILKRTSTGSEINTPEVSTPEVCSPSASSKPLSISLRPCNSVDHWYNIIPSASNATGMGKKRKSVEFAPRPQVYNVPAMQRRPTQRSRQRGFPQHGPAIKAS